MDPAPLRTETVLRADLVDVGHERERVRLRRLRWVLFVAVTVCALAWWRTINGRLPVSWDMTETQAQMLPIFLLLGVIVLIMVLPLIAAGRSPHVLYRPEEISVGLDDVKGIPVVVDEAVRTLNLFLAHATFRHSMGGTPRRAMLFEGPPGTGKTHLAKALAKEAGVPFLFVSSSAFQSMFYGQTNRKIRSYFAALRKMARREGGAIGFIEEIDAIGASRSGMGGSTMREGIAGVVNELLIQLQSFDEPPRGVRLRGWFVDHLNQLLPAHRRLRKPTTEPANILVIGATNRAADLDPALLRPGRFDRSLSFDLPGRAGRRELIDHALRTRAHDAELDTDDLRNRLAAGTAAYSPAMIVHLLDEGLVWALRRGASAMSWDDVQHAKLTEEVGLAHPVDYTSAERRAIATHEAGHATVAWLVGRTRRLEFLSIIKRRDSLGLLAHSDLEERFTKTRDELESLIKIALGGMVAEEHFFGASSSGVASDLKHATDLAVLIVGSLGMAGSLISYESAAGMSANLAAKVLGFDESRERVDALLTSAHDEVRGLLADHRHVVEALRDALLERNELVGDDILDVIKAAQPSPTPSP